MSASQLVVEASETIRDPSRASKIPIEYIRAVRI
jgi:hypothetical protein